MPRSSSFTSNSDGGPRRGRRSTYRRTLLAVVAWSLVFLAVLDIGVGRVFRMPADPLREPSNLQRYFDYGRSIEGKLRLMAGADEKSSALIMHAGWLDVGCGTGHVDSPMTRLDVYGMSFSGMIADQLVAFDPSVTVSSFGGPAAGLNHSYACFLRRLGTPNVKLAPVQVIGVLASSVRRVATISGLSTSFEGPQPFTYPRYRLDEHGALNAYMPSINTEADLLAALHEPAEWNRFLGELQANDAFYSRFIMQADPLDVSTLGRMVRRAIGQHVVRDRTDAMRPQDGFRGDPAMPQILAKLLIDFAERCREARVRPFVILIEDRGLGDSLTTAVAASLKAHQVDYLATSEVVSSGDSRNFMPDGHFVREANLQIAKAVHARLQLAAADPSAAVPQ